MEPEGLRRGLQNILQEENVPVTVLDTDRHIMVSCMMRKEFPQVAHQYDVWHVSKNVTKTLADLAKLKKSDFSPMDPEHIKQSLVVLCNMSRG